MSELLAGLARRVEGDPFFLAFALAGYARSRGLDDAGLAAALGCRPEDLPMLRLCRAPRPDPPDFRADVTAVAGRFGIDPATLVEAVRHGEAVAALRRPAAASPEPGAVLAARDDDRPPPRPEEPS
jgi:hypothetical protein